MFGAGGLLLGQVRLAEHMNEQVESTFFLLRAVGYATFFLQPSDVQLALAVSDLPPGSLEHSERVAVTLLVLGGIAMLCALFVRPRRS